MSTLSYRQILVGRFMTGMVGLDEMFAEFYKAGRDPDEALVPELLARARKDNYIPVAGEAEYAEALLREYRKYCAQQESGCTCRTEYGTWRGIPREQIPWFPTLYEDLCDNCGKCVSFCPEKVFDFTTDDRRVYVASPLKCQVECTECARICPQKAISFPPRTVLQTFGG
ncbi:MAG: 4Fe-4S dicluster domain-containing protein [Anaerolineae bacterium]|nr:4Fe-4S dicluster domain-containing protein [Anaerolineae bacterium]